MILLVGDDFASDLQFDFTKFENCDYDLTISYTYSFCPDMSNSCADVTSLIQLTD